MQFLRTKTSLENIRSMLTGVHIHTFGVVVKAARDPQNDRQSDWLGCHMHTAASEPHHQEAKPKPILKPPLLERATRGGNISEL